MKNILRLLVTYLTLFSVSTMAQPSNDLCSGATTLTVGATCVNTLVTIDGTATDSGVSDPGCAGYTGGDLWYSLTVPASGIVSIDASTDNGSITILGMAIYNGADCNSLTKLTCAFNNGAGGFPSAKVSQTPGSTIYVRVWEIDNNAIGTFNLCATEVLVSPPANDASSGAIDLTVGATCSNTLVTIAGTETDSGEGDPGCARYVGGDLWYKVTVPASGNVKIETDTNDSSITDGGMAVYIGPDASTLTLLECNDAGNTDSLEDFERISVLGRTPGEVVYVRVWSFNNTQGTFNICAVEVPNPSNDLCSGATTLTVGATCVNTLVTIDGTATDSGVSDPGCAGYVGGDLWYKVIVPASGSVKVETSTSGGGITDGGMAVYIGIDCNSLSLLECDDGGNTDSLPNDFERISVFGRTPGEVIYVRVWSYNNSELGTFNICATQIFPLNNEDIVLDNFKIYPNPTNDNVYISIKTGSSFIGDIKVFDLSGKLMLKDNSFDGQLDISKLSKGIYLISLRLDEKMVTKKLIIE